MLKVENLTVHYGAIRAVWNVSFEVEKGEIITLIGANGAGKTSTLHALSNIIKKTDGKVIFDGQDIASLPPDRIVKAGLIQSPEGRRIFANLSVKDNLDMGAYTRHDRKGVNRDREMVFSIFPRIKERLHQSAGTLSGGEQQMLAMGRALMASPRLLLLDEPSMGLSPIMIDEIFTIIKNISDQGTTILLVEQNAYKALAIASRAYILETGAVLKSGPAAELKNDASVRSAYLGG
jgi:branched-chain amino acid transport system ATP-binding protein